MAMMFDSDYAPTVTTVRSAFTPEECQRIIDYGNSKDKVDGVIKNQGVRESRDCKIVWLPTVDDAGWFYRKLSAIVKDENAKTTKFDLSGFVEDLQFTEYISPKGKYDLHTDQIKGGLVRKLSVVVQLSNPDQYQGGELELYLSSTPGLAERAQGTVIIFPSYMMHAVKPVTSGIRYSLVGWVSGPPFK